MIYIDDYANENKIQHDFKLSYITDHPLRILIIGGSGSGKADALSKQSTRKWQNIPICKRSVWNKILISN